MNESPPDIDPLAVVLNTVDFVWSIDSDARFTYLSDGFAQVTGRPICEALGWRARDLPWFRNQPHAVAMRAVRLAARAPLRDSRFIITRADGEVRLLSVSGQARFEPDGTYAGYSGIALDVTESSRSETVFDNVAQALGGTTGADYLNTVVRAVAEALDFDLAFIVCSAEGGIERLDTVAVHERGCAAANFSYDMSSTSSAKVFAGEVSIYPAGAARLFPNDRVLTERGIEAYCGAPLISAQGLPFGILVAVSTRPFTNTDLARDVVQAFAGRAAGELERQAIESSLREGQDLLLQSQRIGRSGYIVTDIPARRVIWSETMFALRGVAPRPPFSFEEALAFIHPDDRAILDEALRESVERQSPYEIELRVVRPDGEIIWERSIGHPLFDAEGKLERRIVFVQEITQLKQAELALRDREREIRQILDNAPLAIFLKDRDARYRLVNRSFEQWFGKSGAQLYGTTGYDAFGAEVGRVSRETDQFVLADGRVSELERSMTYALPAIEHVLVTKFPIRDETGAVTGLAGFITDISERKRAEILLRQKEEEQGAILDNAPVAIFLKDRESRYRLINRQFERWFRCTQAQVFGLRDVDIAPSEVADHSLRTDGDVLESGGEVIYERPAYGVENPAIRQLLVTKFPIRSADNAVVGIAGFLTDVTLRWRAEEALRESEERFRALIEHSNDLVAIVGLDGAWRYHSPSVSQSLGYGQVELTGQSILDIVHRDDVRYLAAALDSISASPGARESGEGRVRHKNGGWRHIAWTARNAADVRGVEGVIVNARDVTEARRLEEQLLQAQKMDAVGQLAGGIAHDFNNVLSVVLGFAGFLMEDLPLGSREHGFASRIARAGERARDVIRQILAFSSQSGVERRPEDLAQVVHDTADLLRSSLPSSTQLEIDALSPGPLARVNAGQIAQVLLNLCLNANDALMGEPGRIGIVVDILAAGQALAAVPKDSVTLGSLDVSCRYGRLTVSDTGCGMPLEVLRRAFDPFFTTKERGRGTGLGLAMVHGIMQASEGVCVVSSRPRIGTTFMLHFPLLETARASDAASHPSRAQRGRERVLVVDDEVDITDMLTTGLDRLGYDTVACNDPREALAAFEEDPTAWDVVVSDHVMPNMRGVKLYERMRACRPSVHFILCTGFSDGATEQQAAALGIAAFFLKPVAVERLAERIRELMDDPAP